MASAAVARAGAGPASFDPPRGPCVEGSDSAEALARPPVVVGAAGTRAGAVVTGAGARLVGGEAPPEPPPELPVVEALERVGALAVPDLLVPLVCPDAGDVVALGVFCAGGVVVAGGVGLEDGVTAGTDGVGIGTGVAGSVGVVGTDGTLGVVGTSRGPTVTGPTVTGPIDPDETAPVAVEISPADACAVAISDTMPAAHRATKADRERTPTARFESIRLDINIPD